MNAREVAEINERRRRMGARPLGDELVALYAGDHDRPYAPVSDAVSISVRAHQPAFCHHLIEALRAGLGPLTIIGPPTRVLMRPDANPFPRFRPFRWLP